MDKSRAFNLLNKMAFTRTGGSAEELRCANMLLSEIESVNGHGRIEEFSVNTETIHTQRLIAEGREYNVVGYGNSGNTPAEGITAPFYYLEQTKDNEVAKRKAKGKIVLVNGYLGIVAYKALVDCGAVGFITFCGSILDKEDESDLMLRELRQPLKDLKVLPGVNMRAADAMELVKQNPAEVTIILSQEESTTMSRNVVAEIEGELAETIVFTAHYDSVHFSKGVYDNGAGSVILMELYRYFMQHKPLRRLVFIWCGSEERGLLGSKAYVKEHEAQLKDIVFCINVDVGATILGSESAICIGEDYLTNITDFMAKEKGHSLFVESNIYSSDSMPFSDKGIPSVNFCRFAPEGGGFIHNRNDDMFFLSEDALASTGEFVEYYSQRIVNSYAFPVKRSIPDELVKKIDKYFAKQINQDTQKQDTK